LSSASSSLPPQYPPSLPPSRPDYRLNFALHCGSVSGPVPAVPIFSRDALEEQLEMMMRWALARSCRLEGGGGGGGRKGGREGRYMSLPRMCWWYHKDFAPDLMAAIVPPAVGGEAAGGEAVDGGRGEGEREGGREGAEHEFEWGEGGREGGVGGSILALLL
ncbi:hypothetical protein Naga_101715g2, partial [Nannochloropsis gaditana]